MNNQLQQLMQSEQKSNKLLFLAFCSVQLGKVDENGKMFLNFTERYYAAPMMERCSDQRRHLLDGLSLATSSKLGDVKVQISNSYHFLFLPVVRRVNI